MSKLTYLSGRNKHQVRNFLFSKMPSCNNIVGLAGPDIQECLKNYRKKGYRNIEVWEKDNSILLLQLSKVNYPIQLRFGDILSANSDLPDTLYDLDYCCTIKYMREHLVKFQNNFIMTFSLRAGVDNTITKFFKDRGETVLSERVISYPFKYTVYKTIKGTYIYTPYFDTSAMCCIAKIK